MRTIDKEMNRIYKSLRLKPGDIYESCNYHPVLCLGVDYKADEIWGVSLIDGSYPRSCSLKHCGVRKLTPKQAWLIKMQGPIDEEIKNNIKKENIWWSPNTIISASEYAVGLVGPRKNNIIKPNRNNI